MAVILAISNLKFFWVTYREPPRKADLGRTKAEMGYFSKNGLWFGFEILHGLLCNKNGFQ